MRKLIALVWLGISCFAYGLEGIYFSHKDWEVACDNSGTCSIAGYNSEELENRPLLVSVLFTRLAGNDALVQGKMNVESKQELKLLKVQIGTQDLGEIQIDESTGIFSAEQTNALLNALKGDEIIKIYSPDLPQIATQLSSQGANAVMLKADEFQHRLNSPSAFLRKGTSKEKVLEPQPIPQISVPKLPKIKILEIGTADYQKAKNVLTNAAKGKCDNLGQSNIIVQPLNEENTLLSTTCNIFAYNSDAINVLVSPNLHKINKVLEARGEYDDNGVISLLMKGRGLGDCWSLENWVWNGKAFQLSARQTTEMCRGFGGGAWVLPTYVSEVTYQ